MHLIAAQAWVLAMWLSWPIPEATKIAIDRIPLLYTPTEGRATAEVLSMGEYHFEINKENTRARVVVNYTYPDEMLFPRTGSSHMPVSAVQIPGLRYDRSAHQIIYEEAGKSTVCATVEEKRQHFGGQGFKISNTGACTVEAVTATHPKDDGWTSHRTQTLDTYFVVH